VNSVSYSSEHEGSALAVSLFVQTKQSCVISIADNICNYSDVLSVASYWMNKAVSSHWLSFVSLATASTYNILSPSSLTDFVGRNPLLSCKRFKKMHAVFIPKSYMHV